ncbi:MAG: hypothetical protein HC769_36045 [Cyanobacteria bacterium CRU_2_1]|nr:hypothetical protein [Cyanobacteria bacterium CRU_2_1]
MTGEPERKRQPRPLAVAFNRLLVTLSFAILLSLIVSLVAQAFSASAELGIRSLAAAILPALIIAYATVFGRPSRPSSQFPAIGLFFFTGTWMIALLFFINFVNSYSSHGNLLSVFALSVTLSALVLLTKFVPFSSLLSCSYGIIAGVLLYTLIFGLSE